MTEHPPARPSPSTDPRPLASWKEIAAYLDRDVSTVKRWEKTEGLPVHRQMHQVRSSVYAFTRELDAWRAHRTPNRRESSARPRHVAARAPALIAILLVSLSSAGHGLLGPVRAASGMQGLVLRQVWSGPDVDTYGAPSPDGRYLTFVDWSSGDLAVRDLATGETRRLTGNDTPYHAGEASRSVFSPDGTRIAYGWMNYQAGHGEAWVVGVDGTDAHLVYSDPGVSYLYLYSWAADGRSLLATLTDQDGTNRMAIVSAQDGSVRTLRSFDGQRPERMSFSPDARYVAYDFPEGLHAPERDIFVHAVEEHRDVRLVAHAANDVLLGWSPDGTTVLFASDRTDPMSVWALPVSDGGAEGPATLVKAGVGRVAPVGFAATGDFYFGLHTQLTEVFLADVDAVTGGFATPPRPIPQRRLGASSGADWSPDGTELGHVVPRSPAAGVSASMAVIHSLETGAERQILLPRIRSAYEFLWSPNGDEFLVGGIDDTGRQGTFVLSARTGDLVTAIPGAYWGHWSRDGRQIIYAGSDPPNRSQRLVVRDRDTGRERVLFQGQVGIGLAVSPDGGEVAYSSAEGPGEATLRVIPIRGGAAHDVLHLRGSDFGAKAWTRSGHLVFVRRDWADAGQRPELWSVPVEGGTPQRLGRTVRSMTQVSIGPDGQRIAFNAGELRSEIWVLEQALRER